MVEDIFEDDQLSSMSADDILRASRLLDNEVRALKVSLLFQLMNKKSAIAILKKEIRYYAVFWNNFSWITYNDRLSAYNTIDYFPLSTG